MCCVTLYKYMSVPQIWTETVSSLLRGDCFNSSYLFIELTVAGKELIHINLKKGRKQTAAALQISEDLQFQATPQSVMS